MSISDQTNNSGCHFQDYPFQDKLQDRKEHYKSKKLFRPRIKHKESGLVKFRVEDILCLIREKKLENNPKANLVFHFAAYKEADWNSYQTKPGAKQSGITKDQFINRPTLILAYENSPISVESFDCGVLCPPPPGC